MDEQRLQAYARLIKQILDCSSGQEIKLLQENRELVDDQLWIVMEQSAIVLESRGDPRAGWLRRATAQLAMELRLVEETPTEASSQDANKFLLGIVQLILQTQGDRTQVYGFLQANLGRLNQALLAALPGTFENLIQQHDKALIEAIFVEFGNLIQQFPLGTHWLNLELSIAAYEQVLAVTPQEAMPVEWAQTLMNLATTYYSRIRGDRAENIEQAIAACKQALTVITQAAMPVEWAKILSNLAAAYVERIWGERAENIEQAVAAYKQALTVMTQEAMPIEWSTTLMNLAIAYYFRIRGDRAENVEQAISFYKQVLTVRTQQAMPVEWATTLMNLANAYVERIRGDRAENIEQAITAYKQALTVITQEAIPIEWAKILINLATAYAERIKGDRPENLEQAIAAYEQALTVITEEAMPILWATTRNNLANTYYSRIRGSRAENIEQAIAAYEQVLTVRTQQAMPVEWAQTLVNLANAYYFRIQGDRAENIEQAILFYKQALTVITQEAIPIEWAKIFMNLANVYKNRIQGERAENIEQAILSYKQALTVRTQQAMPIRWATTLMNLAGAYSERLRGNHTGNIEQAIAAYESSLTVFGSELLPNECRMSASGLGNLYSEQHRWQDAISSYQKALQASETLYQNANLLDSRAAELAATADLPRRAAYALARAGDLQAATLTLEQGRARGLSENLERDRSNLTRLQQPHPALFNQYQDITNQIRNLEAQQRLRMTSEERHNLTPEIFRTTAQQLRQTLTETVEQIRQVEGYANFLAQPDFNDIQQAVRPDVPLVYLISTPLGSLALIVTQTGIADVWLDELNEIGLIDLLNTTWFSAYNQSRTNHQAWLDTIDQVTQKLWQPLMAPLINYLKRHAFQQAILIPTGYLSLLPLHTAWVEDSTTPTGRRYALDEIGFTYAPNARSLTAADAIAQLASAEAMVAIDNPLKDLPNSSREVAAAIASFPQPKVLKYEEATVESVLAVLPDCNILHLSCHGTADLREPLNSGLAMNDGLLTLRQFLDLKLSDQGGIRLVVLSACETGLVGTELADEAISLPTGLLQAGVAGVIASLWSVSDLSTMLLLSKFYELWRIKKQEPSEALRQSQLWLRDSTDGEIANSMGLFTPTPDDRSYSHPFHWAAFSYTGV